MLTNINWDAVVRNAAEKFVIQINNGQFFSGLQSARVFRVKREDGEYYIDCDVPAQERPRKYKGEMFRIEPENFEKYENAMSGEWEADVEFWEDTLTIYLDAALQSMGLKQEAKGEDND